MPAKRSKFCVPTKINVNSFILNITAGKSITMFSSSISDEEAEALVGNINWRTLMRLNLIKKATAVI